MASQFWDLSNSVIRGEDDVCGSFEQLPNHPAPFGADGSSWLWGESDMFSESRSGLLFDLPDGMFGKLNPHSEPVSPSSVATTPTTSEHPVSGVSSSHALRDGECFDHDEGGEVEHNSRAVSHIHINKRIRKTYSAPAAMTTSTMDKNGRKKKYDAPPGVWRNSGGFISTVYINKKRVYGPLRRDVADAVKDREEMLLAKTVITSEEGMRAFVQCMKERWGPTRISLTCVEDIPLVMGAPSLDACSVESRPSLNSASSRNTSQAVRISSRPMRAAAKRNLFATFSQSSLDEDVVDTMEDETQSLPPSMAFDHEDSTAFF